MARIALADDPVAARSKTLFWAFGWYLRWYFGRHFHAVRISRAGLPQVPAGRPLIIYTNHPSWWDPALFILLSRSLLRDRHGYGPMEQHALDRYGLFRRFGVFGIDTESRRGAARFLDVSTHVLSDPGNALWITAEGAFTDPRLRPVQLRPGLAHLARRTPDAVLLPLAIEYTFWNERKPEALLRFGEPITAKRGRDVAAWTTLLEDGLTRTMDALAQDSLTRNPALFLSILERGGGVGGIYDLWRRGRAWAAGRRFDPSHEVPSQKVQADRGA